jgi:hypothetical protein
LSIPLEANAAAKGYALAISEHFLATEHTHFDVISIMSSMIIGKNELDTTAEEIIPGTDGVVVGLLIGRKVETSLTGVSVALDDVVRAHFDAINPEISGNWRLLCLPGGLQGTN